MPEGAEAFAEWLTSEGRSSNTVAAYRRDVAAYERWQTDNPGGSLAEYVQELRATRKASSAARGVVALRIYHRWAHGEDAPIEELRGVPVVEEKEEDDLDEDAVARLVAATAGESFERRRDAVVIALLYFAGLKASEAISLDVGDVTADETLITVDRDGAHERVLPAVPVLAEALRRWLHPAGRDRLHPTTDGVLVNQRGQRLTRQGLWLLTGAVSKRAGLGDTLSPNALRRACSSHLAMRGLPAPAIAAFLGHTARQAPGAGMLNETGWGSCNLVV